MTTTRATGEPTMTGPRRVALAIGLPLVAALVAYAAFGLIGLMGRVTVRDDASYAVPSAQHLTISTHGSITVTGGNVDAIEVRRTSSYGISAPHHTAEDTGEGLALTSSCPWWNLFNCSVDYDVTVPAGLAVDLHTGSGSIRIAGLNAAVRADTGSGSIVADGIGGALTLSTGSGSVTATGVTAGEVAASSGSGAVRLSFAHAPTAVDAEAGSGAVVIEVPVGSGPYRVQATTGSGSRTVDVRTDPAATSTLTAHTGSGSVTVREAG